FFKLAGIRERTGFNFKKRGRFLTKKIDIPSGYEKKHVARYYMQLLSLFDIKPKDYGFDLFLSKEDILAASDILKENGLTSEKKLVLVCPGSGDSWQKTAYYKRWPESHFLALIDMLLAEFDCQIVLCGSKQEIYITSQIIQKAQKRITDLTGRLGLMEFAAIMQLSYLVISNDGGPFHIAQALGKNVLGFFGPVDETVYGAYPNDSKSIIFSSDVDCRPCYKRFRFQGCVHDKKCLRRIEPVKVFNRIKSTFLF
ncbi:MAG: glycosyltransferase family 9 protein, partial [Candidatus Omnitrophica bacterium]|nr:glycosyltransferase family 9 protein [Candidatus Omnitrophota bacterium]